MARPVTRQAVMGDTSATVRARAFVGHLIAVPDLIALWGFATNTRSNRTMKSSVRMACALALAGIACASANARTAKSMSYEFEYASSGLGGGKATAGAYALVGKASEIGSAGFASSAS